MKFSYRWQWFHSSTRRWSIIVKLKSQEWTNVFHCWCIAIYSNFILFWLKIVDFLWNLFLISKCIFILNVSLKVWTIILLHIFIAISWILMILNRLSTYKKKSSWIWLPYRCDLRIVSNDFSFRCNKNWAPESLLFRRSNETTIRSMKLRVKYEKPTSSRVPTVTMDLLAMLFTYAMWHSTYIFQWPYYEKWYMKIHIGRSRVFIDASVA